MTISANTTSTKLDSAMVDMCNPAANDECQRVIVVGSGPAGLRFAHEFLQRQPAAKLSLFGDEPSLPYNRVQLSALLAGDIQYEQILSPLPSSDLYPNFCQVNAQIERIDTITQCTYDQLGNIHFYDHLILATGSRPHIPHIPGVEQTGVYTFRNLKDTESLYSRVARARHVVIIGGGLLGLEAARALLRANTLVTVIQQGPRLMNRQLDDIAAAYLSKKVEALGIRVITDSGVRQILGDGRVTGVVTRSGDKVECDTVLLCAGIKPLIELARDARLKVGNGILVDDQLKTSANNVYAIGECCEHRGKTYGLVNPGFEQAAIAADVICNGHSRYVGSLQISRLKVLGENVCSMGEVCELAQRPFLKEWVYNSPKRGVYRKLVVDKGHLIGAVGFGEWAEVRRVQEAYQNQRKMRLWHRLRFLLSGNIWGDSANDDVGLWPATTVVCQCNNITQGQLVNAMTAGAINLTLLSEKTGAGTVCGACKPLLANLAGETHLPEQTKGWLPLTISSVLALLIATAIFCLPGISVSDSILSPAPLEQIWNNKFWKQVTGFSLLTLSAFGLLISLRKRINNSTFGNFAYWRLLHVFLGLACTVILVLHTGLHLGENLNRWLMMDFLALVSVGALAGCTIAFAHWFSANQAQKIRRFWVWAHIFLVWPLPVLLAMHILTVYYF